MRHSAHVADGINRTQMLRLRITRGDSSLAWQAEDSCGSVHLLEDFHVHWYDDRVHIAVTPHTAQSTLL